MKLISCFSIVIISTFFVFGKALASPFSYLISTEKTESGKTRSRVFEVDSSSLEDQSRISQQMIYEKIGDQSDRQLIREALQQKEISLSSKTNLAALSRPGHFPLWVPVKETWTEADELDYSQWFAQNVNENFNTGSGLFADCADVGLLLRWAYAHDKKLPVANSLGSTDKLFGHFTGSEAWDKLSTNADWRKDERFKAAMKYLFDNTYTHTLFTDLYPTEINSKYLRPGLLYMIIREKSGHTQTIRGLDQAGSSIQTLWGNEPANDQIFASDLMWEPAVKNIFGAWRWPIKEGAQWKLTIGSKMPGYSTEQFTKRQEFVDDPYQFEMWVYSKIGFADFDVETVKRKIRAVRYQLQYRVSVTALGSVICGLKPCDLSSAEYDNYTTGIRDGRIRQFQEDLIKTVDLYGGMQSATVQNAIAQSDLDEVLIEGFQLTYRVFIFSPERVLLLKSDGNLNFSERWGLTEFPNDTVKFQFLTQEFNFALYQRLSLFHWAMEYCNTDGTCSSHQDLNTTFIDQGLSLLGSQLAQLMATPELQADPIIIPALKDRYRSSQLSYTRTQPIQNDNCEDKTQCKLYDVLFFNDGFLRIKNWNHLPEENYLSRWNL